MAAVPYLPARTRVYSRQRSYKWVLVQFGASAPPLRVFPPHGVPLWDRGIGLRSAGELRCVEPVPAWNWLRGLALVVEAADHLREKRGQHFLLEERVAVVDFDDDLVAGDFGGDFGGDDDRSA